MTTYEYTGGYRDEPDGSRTPLEVLPGVPARALSETEYQKGVARSSVDAMQRLYKVAAAAVKAGGRAIQKDGE